jgi:hypothetical protein
MTALITKMKKAVLPSRAPQHNLSVLTSSSAFRKLTNAMAFQTVMMGVTNKDVVSSADLVCLATRMIASPRLIVHCVRFEVFTAVTMKNGVFWNVTLCGPCQNRRFGGT